MKTKLLRKGVITSKDFTTSRKCTVQRLFKVKEPYDVIPTEKAVRRLSKNCGLNPDHMFCTIGTATCSPNDKYDPAKGEKIASMRSLNEALGRYKKFLMLSEVLLQHKIAEISEDIKKTEKYMEKCRSVYNE